MTTITWIDRIRYELFSYGIAVSVIAGAVLIVGRTLTHSWSGLLIAITAAGFLLAACCNIKKEKKIILLASASVGLRKFPITEDERLAARVPAKELLEHLSRDTTAAVITKRHLEISRREVEARYLSLPIGTSKAEQQEVHRELVGLEAEIAAVETMEKLARTNYSKAYQFLAATARVISHLEMQFNGDDEDFRLRVHDEPPPLGILQEE